MDTLHVPFQGVYKNSVIFYSKLFSQGNKDTILTRYRHFLQAMLR
jgi:hypothetical protein